MRNSEKGAALIVSIMVFSVMLILAAAFIPLAFSEQANTIHGKKWIQAYYTARSGADAAAAAIINNNMDEAYNKARDLLDSINPSPSVVTGDLGTGSFRAEVKKESDGSITIVSAGKVNDVVRNVTLSLGILKASDVFDKAVYSGDPIGLNLNMAAVEGDVESADLITGNSYVTGNSLPNSSRHYESPVFEMVNNLREPAAIIDRQNGEVQQFAELAFENEPVEFKTGTDGSDLYVYADTVDLNGGVTVTGGGRLYLYIRTYASFSDTFHSASDKMIIHLADDSSCIIQANDNFKAYVYGPKANISLEDNAHVTGAIIGDSIILSSSASVNFERVSNEFYIPSIINYRRLGWE